jgi:hypothetical protein
MRSWMGNPEEMEVIRRIRKMALQGVWTRRQPLHYGSVETWRPLRPRREHMHWQLLLARFAIRAAPLPICMSINK